jgi:hypothetical protein
MAKAKGKQQQQVLKGTLSQIQHYGKTGNDTQSG